MLVAPLLLAIGFILLAKGGDLLVDGSSSMAKHFNISELVIGLTIVSLGTSTPELIVNIIASINDNSGIALGNVVGSNICNTLLILGTAGMVAPITVQRGTVWREIPFAFFISLILALLLNDSLFNGSGDDLLSRNDGFILLLLFAVFMYYIFTLAQAGNEVGTDETSDMGTWKSIFFIIIGLTGLAAGGKMVVWGAVDIASAFGVSEAMIGLTIVAIGTSLPELFASTMAAGRGKSDIAIGNVVGSNIFNILFVLGVSSSIKDLPFPAYMNLDLGLVILSIFFVFCFMFLWKKHRIDRPEAFILLLTYIAYMAYLIIRK